MNDTEQLPLFDVGPGEGQAPPEKLETRRVTPDTPLADAIEVYIEALQLGGFSIYTIKAFKSDIGLLASWTESTKPIGQIGTADLSRFLHWLMHERGVPCSPKSYARRVTALKNFFGYLHEMRFISSDPSKALIQQSVESPLPEVLSSEELERVLAITESLRHSPEKPDARPHLLVTLLLQTAIKKSECMAIRPEHIDTRNPESPVLWIRYANPRMRYKERKITLKPDWLVVLDEYIQQRQPNRVIFDCTARNLEYVLRDISNQAKVPNKKLSFEFLRWSAALQDYRANMDHDKLRQKLGLSRIAWRETSGKLAQLAKDYEASKAANTTD